MEKTLQTMSMDDYISAKAVPRWDYELMCNGEKKTLLIRARNRPDPQLVKQIAIKNGIFPTESFDKLRVKLIGG